MLLVRGSVFLHSNPARGRFETLGNPNLEPPRTISYELGVNYNLLNQYLIRLGTYYKDVTGQHGDVSYQNIDGTVEYDSYLNNEYEDIHGFELVITKSVGDWVSGWLNYNYMLKKQGLTGRETFYEDPSKSAFFGLYEGQESRFIPRPRLTANIMIGTPLNWGPAIAGHKILGGLRLSILPTWQAGESFTWNPLGKFHLSDNLQWPDYNVWDIKIAKDVGAGPLNVEVYCNVRNIFNNKATPLEMAFSGSSDTWNYFSSLHLPMYDSSEFDDLRSANPGLFVAGNDKPGMLRSEEHSYINDPNYDLFLHGNQLPRDIWFGLRLRF
ncbi:MAG: TonB-dependent receptor [Calditrichota bacterium]